MGFAVGSVFLLALLAPGLIRIFRSRSGWWMAAPPLALTIYFLARIEAVSRGGTFTEAWPWLPELGIGLTFQLDGLSLVFVLLITGVGALIMLYSGSYLAGHKELGRFFLLLYLFMGSMLGLVLAANLITLFVFWELTSLTSFLLIGFDHQREKVPASALQALLVTSLGGLALLASLLLMGEIAGTLEFGLMAEKADLIREHAWYLPIVLLAAAGAFTKSAQFPFHFWLPNAMQAPTPVSAYLHSATMVKAGIYLLFRLSPILGETALWHGLLETVGGFTMLGGIWLALRQTDLKRLLAYATVSSLGTLVFLIGLDIPRSLEAAIVYLVAHALYKAPLFLAVGAIDHATGSRDLRGLGGLFRQMPLVGIAVMMAVLSMAGVIPFIGFLGKELFYEVVLSAPRAAAPSILAALLTSLLMVAVSSLTGLRPFFGTSRFDRLPHGPVPPGQWLPPLILATIGLGAGLFAGTTDRLLVTPSLRSLLPGYEAPKLALWHGFTPVLGFSVLTLVGGYLIYRQKDFLVNKTERWAGLARYGAEVAYERLLAKTFAFSGWQTALLQNGRLRYYLLMIFITATVFTGAALIGRGDFSIAFRVTPLQYGDLIVSAIILAAAWVTAHSGERLVAILAMGVVGYGVALLYAMFGAPDVAMTQFSIETMTVLLFVLIFHRLPLFSRLVHRRTLRLDAAVSIAAGLLMTILTLVALGGPRGERISGFFLDRSVPEGFGRNVVNTILVDFRALDTLGEITVLGMAGVGIWALLKFSPQKRKNR
ncbi:MAG: hydrogen gas-evolving membrane-bound hydrogenase subunit E [Syntrophotaleaceae bacterium]